ncbi:MAG TPA: MFS transporter [Bryobacteraceae bacterium]|nr:MFS transporter [Bryobacteraceae bacterium]
MTASATEPHNSPWLFGVVVLPYGFTTSVTVLLMPYLLRRYGMPVDRIAEISAIAILPAIWSFLWSPVADTGLRRRSWIIVSSVASAVASAIAVLDVHGGQAMLTALLFLSNALTGLLGAACGALLTAMPEGMRGRASGWYQAGNVGGGAAAGGAVIWLADHASLSVVAAAVAAAMILPSLAALLLKEPAPARRAIGPLIAGMAHDLRDLLRSRRTWLGLAFFLSPVGTAAVTNLISSVGPDYHASGNEVAVVTGVAGGLLSALACFLGGIVADRMNRMTAYALAGVLTAIPAAWMALGPLSGLTYGVGYAGYSIATGFAYAVYTALLLDIVGKREHAAAFAYSALNASGNASISYMTWLDGIGYKRGGARGLMGMDAAANGIFAVILLVVAAFQMRRRVSVRPV